MGAGPERLQPSAGVVCRREGEDVGFGPGLRAAVAWEGVVAVRIYSTLPRQMYQCGRTGWVTGGRLGHVTHKAVGTHIRLWAGMCCGATRMLDRWVANGRRFGASRGAVMGCGRK